MLLWRPISGINSHLWLLHTGLRPSAKHRASVTTGELNQMGVSVVLCTSTPGTSAPFPPLPPPYPPPLPSFLPFPLSPFPSPLSSYLPPLPSSIFLLLPLPSFPSLTLPSSPTVEKVLQRGRHAITPHVDDQPTTDNHFIDAPPSTITDTFLPPPPPAPITTTNTTCPTPTTSVATSDYLPPATSNREEEWTTYYNEIFRSSFKFESSDHNPELAMGKDTVVIETIAFSVDEVGWVLNQIKPGQSPGPDRIPEML
ncbi:unnamed protein product [Schistocephalus solidus]|uniref:Uncharacterized protein n=1 Tax=Schistocephalus solidus TaxID=70667 RepID=A0A183SS74_SCHSO|nr:unnamed protein product [Schistocephalus solidus]